MRLKATSLVLTVAITLATAFARKQKPHSCLHDGPCLVDLHWSHDSRDCNRCLGVSIFGTLMNTSKVVIGNPQLAFQVYDERDSIIGTVTGRIDAIPPGGRWDFRIFVEHMQAFPFVPSKFLYTKSATIQCTVPGPDNMRKTTSDTFNFEPLFHPDAGWEARRYWRSKHPK